MEQICYLFVNGIEIIKFKAKESEILATPFCLGNISKDFSVTNMKKTGLNGYICDFSIDYDAIAAGDILDIHKYKMFGFVKKVFVQQLYFSVVIIKCKTIKMCFQINQECKVRPEMINTNSNKPSFYPYSVKISKCSSSCNNINDPYAEICIHGVVKNKSQSV